MVFSQHPGGARCGNEVWLPQQRMNDPLFHNILEQNGLAIQLFGDQDGAVTLDRQQITIAVVVHIVWHNQDENISDEMVYSQIEALNRDFSAINSDTDQLPAEFGAIRSGDTGIRFCLATVDTLGNPTTGIVRVKTMLDEVGLSDSLYYNHSGGSNAWAPNKYLNIWVANTGEFISGFGTYPNMADTDKTGIVIHPQYFGQKPVGKYNRGRTVVHEAGHYLGLLHPWGTDNNCDTDDGISDTPPQEKAYTGCPAFPQFSCGSSNVFMNYMDYVDDKCMFIFTSGQKTTMLANLALFRPELMNDRSCSSQFNCNSSLRIYPNPAYAEALLELSSDCMFNNNVQYRLYNTFGALLQNGTIEPGNAATRIMLAGLPKGLYFCQVISGSQFIGTVKLFATGRSR